MAWVRWDGLFWGRGLVGCMGYGGSRGSLGGVSARCGGVRWSRKRPIGFRVVDKVEG